MVQTKRYNEHKYSFKELGKLLGMRGKVVCVSTPHAPDDPDVVEVTEVVK